MHVPRLQPQVGLSNPRMKSGVTNSQAPSSLVALDVSQCTSAVGHRRRWRAAAMDSRPQLASVLQGIRSLRSLSCYVRLPSPCRR